MTRSNYMLHTYRLNTFKKSPSTISTQKVGSHNPQRADALAKKGLSPQELRRTAAAMGAVTERLIIALHAINIIAELLVPCIIIEATKADPLPSFALVTMSVVWWMKLVSYAHMNWDLRCVCQCQSVVLGIN